MQNSQIPSQGSTPLSRRKFLALSGLAVGALALPGCASTRRTLTANDKLNVICVGAGGKGGSDIANCDTENIIAICDVDERVAAPVMAKYPKAKYYQDWRVMLEREKTADAVTVSTPDHTHATIAAAAMRMKKAVYVQKPLTHSVDEARVLLVLGMSHKVITQMGNQGSAEDGLRRAVEVIQSGLIGQVRNVHVWTNRPIWPQGMGRPQGSDPIPPGLNWDLWLGPAPARPFKKDIYHQFNWRGWQDFGTGAVGDMGCHTANVAFRALELGVPRTIEADTSGINSESYPKNARIRYVFPERGNLAPVDFWWYSGGRLPDEFLRTHVENLMDKMPTSGCLFVGDKGIIFSPDDYGARFFIKLWDEEDLVPGTQHEAVLEVPQSIPRNRFKGDTGWRHTQEWIAACKGEGTPYSDFAVATALTEMLLLGCVAMHSNQRLRWDAKAMRMTNAPELDVYLKPDYRSGWTL